MFWEKLIFAIIARSTDCKNCVINGRLYYYYFQQFLQTLTMSRMKKNCTFAHMQNVFDACRKAAEVCVLLYAKICLQKWGCAKFWMFTHVKISSLGKKWIKSDKVHLAGKNFLWILQPPQTMCTKFSDEKVCNSNRPFNFVEPCSKTASFFTST